MAVLVVYGYITLLILAQNIDGVDSYVFKDGCIESRPGNDYAGTETKTSTGVACILWSEAVDYKDLPNNYCRSPDLDTGGPWCYTSTSGLEWDYCFIPLCDSALCLQNDDPTGEKYVGKVDTTTSGIACVLWTLSGLAHDPVASWTNDGTIEHAKNYCRNPDSQLSPYCYTSEVLYEDCTVPSCNDLTTGAPEGDTTTEATEGATSPDPSDVTTPSASQSPSGTPPNVTCLQVSGSSANYFYMGAYSPEAELHNDKPSYKHKTCEFYIFWQGSAWVMSSSLDDTADAPIESTAPADADTPESVTAWQEEVGGTMEASAGLTVTASACDTTSACGSVVVASDVATGTPLGSGTFTLIEADYGQGHPAYKHESMSLYLFFKTIECTDFWIVGPVLGDKVGVMQAENAKAIMPVDVDPSITWQVVNAARAWESAQVTITCT